MVFCNCWPICEPRQSRDFRASTTKWLEQIRKDSIESEKGRWPKTVPVRRSYLDECRGERFENIIWALGTMTAEHVLITELKQYLSEKPMLPNIYDDLDNDTLISLNALCSQIKANYSVMTERRELAKKKWIDIKGDMDELNNRLVKDIEDTDTEIRDMRKKNATAGAVLSQNATLEEVTDQRESLADDSRRLWKNTSGWIESNKYHVEMVDAAMSDKSNAVQLKGSKNVFVAPPQSMSSEWSNWFTREGLAPYQGTKPNLEVTIGRESQTQVFLIPIQHRADHTRNNQYE
ncbi:hypothetical protein H4219_002682 [Mycoemilia scoparia]|uniref:HAUS augmin-like complex subunit 6 N-terminal domain-containing protein n=1 Tax=Mycoemilia scoparia TaxID=417184 RepID=A0A9W7ZXM5_9FUNG|nr:hypothetical protein H4219_002682 [Mycoemilia scoparia]